MLAHDALHCKNLENRDTGFCRVLAVQCFRACVHLNLSRARHTIAIMTSCEHSRSSAYEKDLRWRIIWQKEGLQLSDDTIASNLNIDKSTVSRTMERFITTGTVDKLPYPKERATRKLTDPAKLFIFHLVLNSPGITLREIQEELLYTLLIQIDVSNICRLLALQDRN